MICLGGAAACVTAGRLAEADPSLKILVGFQESTFGVPASFINHSQVVEAGAHTRDVPDHIQPARYFRCLTRPTESFTFHIGKPTPSLLNRSVIVPAGRALGGGSSVNCARITLPWQYMF